jgi:fibronectin type 3 domain-containing protein
MPGQTAPLNVAYAPLAAGNLAGNVTVTSNASNSAAVISLAGTSVQSVSHSVTVSWTPSTSTVVGYNQYRSTISGGPYAKVNPTAVPTESYDDATVQAGQTYYYVVTAMTSANVESIYSNEVSASIPTP